MTARSYAIQAMPALLRPLVVPRDGHVFVAWDFRAAEIFTLAGLSGDAGLLEVLGAGLDPYRFSAACLFDEGYGSVTGGARARAKVLFLSVLYGRGAFTVAQELGSSRAEAQELIDRLLALFPIAGDYLRAASDFAVEHRRVVSLLGRERVLVRGRKDKLRRLGANTVIQGSAATIFKERMLALDDELVARGWGETVVPLHDGALLEVREGHVGEAIALARGVLPVTPLLPMDIPVKVGVGSDWGAAEENAE